jgi:hypothetical protein
LDGSIQNVATEFGKNFPIVGNNTSAFAFPTATGANALAAGFGATAAMAVSGFITPSAPGKTTVTLSSGFFAGEGAAGVNFAHRLNLTSERAAVVTANGRTLPALICSS